MELTWDPWKRRSNLAKHGVDFRSLERFDWATAVIAEDARQDYGERRYQVAGLIDGTLHILIFTPRANDEVRVISLRRGSSKESKKYDQAKKGTPRPSGP